MTQLQQVKKYDVGPELRSFNTLLRKGAVNVLSMILGFLNLITSIPQKNTVQSVDSSQPVTAGPQKSSVPKSESAEYFVRTATGNTHLSNKITTPTQPYEPPCEKSILPTELEPKDCERIRKGIIDGTLDLRTISMATWLLVSYLNLYDMKETHAEQAIAFQGNVYNLHFCVAGVVPPAQTDKLRNKQ